MLQRDFDLQLLYALRNDLRILSNNEKALNNANDEYEYGVENYLERGLGYEPDEPDEPHGPIGPRATDKDYRKKLEKYIKELKKYRSELIKYREEYKKYLDDQDEYRNRKATLKRENAQKFKEEIEGLNQKRQNAKNTLYQTKARIASNNVLASSEKTLEVVDFVIDKLERRRADSVKEALNLMDDESRRRAQAMADAQWRAWEAQRARDEQWQRDREQFWHNYNMQTAENERVAQAKRAADELERIRKDLES